MKTSIKIFCLVCLSLLAAAWGRSWDDIRKTAADIKSVEASFTQEKHMKILARPLISKGKFFYQAPDSLRWEYSSPIKSVLLMHQGKINRYLQTDKGLTEDNSVKLQSMQIVLQEISRWIKGDFEGNPDFSAALKPGRLIVLTPKSEGLKKIIQRIELKLAVNPGVIDRVTIHEGPSAYTILKFSGVKINQPIKQSFFRKS